MPCRLSTTERGTLTIIPEPEIGNLPIGYHPPAESEPTVADAVAAIANAVTSRLLRDLPTALSVILDEHVDAYEQLEGRVENVIYCAIAAVLND